MRIVLRREKDDGVELQIRDDGKGFDTSAPPPEGHFGSVMMKERALVTGGTFKIESELGQGKIDLPAVFAALSAVSFRGWAVVELDAVPEVTRLPKESAARG